MPLCRDHHLVARLDRLYLCTLSATRPEFRRYPKRRSSTARDTNLAPINRKLDVYGSRLTSRHRSDRIRLAHPHVHPALRGDARRRRPRPFRPRARTIVDLGIGYRRALGSLPGRRRGRHERSASTSTRRCWRWPDAGWAAARRSRRLVSSRRRCHACDAVVASFALHHVRTREAKRVAVLGAFTPRCGPAGVFLSVDCQPATGRLGATRAVRRVARAISTGDLTPSRVQSHLQRRGRIEDVYVPLDAEIALMQLGRLSRRAVVASRRVLPSSGAPARFRLKSVDDARARELGMTLRGTATVHPGRGCRCSICSSSSASASSGRAWRSRSASSSPSPRSTASSPSCSPRCARALPPGTRLIYTAPGEAFSRVHQHRADRRLRARVAVRPVSGVAADRAGAVHQPEEVRDSVRADVVRRGCRGLAVQPLHRLSA